MVWSSYMRFWQQFEIYKLLICAKFQGNESRNFKFRTRKLPQKFDVKSGLIQKRFKGAFRLDAKQREATRSEAKQPKFDVIDSSRKVATGRNFREQLCNIACLQAVVR